MLHISVLLWLRDPSEYTQFRNQVNIFPSTFHVASQHRLLRIRDCVFVLFSHVVTVAYSSILMFHVESIFRGHLKVYFSDSVHSVVVVSHHCSSFKLFSGQIIVVQLINSIVDTLSLEEFN